MCLLSVWQGVILARRDLASLVQILPVQVLATSTFLAGKGRYDVLAHLNAALVKEVSLDAAREVAVGLIKQVSLWSAAACARLSCKQRTICDQCSCIPTVENNLCQCMQMWGTEMFKGGAAEDVCSCSAVLLHRRTKRM